MALNSIYKYKIEAHCHTAPASPCGDVSPEEAVRLYKALDYDAVVITNHFVKFCTDRGSCQESVDCYLEDYHRAKRLGDELGINILLGVEIRFPENINDYLVYGVEESDLYTMYNYLDKSYEEFYRDFHSERTVIAQAHPFRDKMVLQDPALLDGIEVMNLHTGHNSRIGLAGQYAAEHPALLRLCGTDFHHVGQQGMCAMRTQALPRDSIELAQIMRSREYLFSVWDSLVLPYSQLS